MNAHGVRIVRSNWLVPRNYAAITLGSTIIIRHDVTMTLSLLAHEHMHVQQWRRHGIVGFLLRYGWSWAREGFSYHRIDFEEDAREPNEEARAWANDVLRVIK